MVENFSCENCGKTLSRENKEQSKALRQFCKMKNFPIASKFTLIRQANL